MDNLTERELEKLLKKKRKQNKKVKFSKQIVTLVIALNIIFTTTILFVFLRTGNEPSTLVGAWFSFTTIELWSLSKIKRTKVKEGNNNEY